MSLDPVADHRFPADLETDLGATRRWRAGDDAKEMRREDARARDRSWLSAICDEGLALTSQA